MTTSMDARVLAVLRTYGHTKSQLDKILHGLHANAGMYDLGAILDRLVVEKKIKVSNRPGDEGGGLRPDLSRSWEETARRTPGTPSQATPQRSGRPLRGTTRRAQARTHGGPRVTEHVLCDRCHGESPNHETWCPTVVGANTETEQATSKERMP